MANDAQLQDLLSLQKSIDRSMEELRQLHQRPTLDDFQEYWRKRVEANLFAMRQELRDLESHEGELNLQTS